MKGYSDKITRQFNFNKWKIKSSNQQHSNLSSKCNTGFGYSSKFKKRKRNKKIGNLTKIQAKNFPQDFFQKKKKDKDERKVSFFKVRPTRRNIYDWEQLKPSTSQSQSITNLRFQKKPSLRSEQKAKPTSERKHRHVSFQVNPSRKKKPYQFSSMSQNINALEYYNEFFKPRYQSQTPMTPNPRNSVQQRLHFPSISTLQRNDYKPQSQQQRFKTKLGDMRMQRNNSDPTFLKYFLTKPQNVEQRQIFSAKNQNFNYGNRFKFENAHFQQQKSCPKKPQSQQPSQNQFIEQNVLMQQNNFIQQNNYHSFTGDQQQFKMAQHGQRRTKSNYKIPNFNLNQEGDLNGLININIQVPKGKKKRQGPLVKICISQGTSKKRKQHLQHLKDILKQNTEAQPQKKNKKRIVMTQQRRESNAHSLKKFFPDQEENKENEIVKDEVLDFSFNQAYNTKKPQTREGKKKPQQINISISITPSDTNSQEDEEEKMNHKRHSKIPKYFKQKKRKQRGGS